MKHTKGIWITWDAEIIEAGHRSLCVISSDSADNNNDVKPVVCVISPSDYVNDEDIANAKLIASAPELLEALQRFVDYADGVKAYEDQRSGYISKFESSMVLQAKEAIKKATE